MVSRHRSEVKDDCKNENAGCNYGASPIFSDRAIDEINHDPFELLFVKFKGTPPFDTEIERRALVYQKWLEQQPAEQQSRRFRA